MDFGQVHHIEYYVNDLQRSNEFWSWLLLRLGYRKYQEWPEGVSWSHTNGTYLVFVQVKPSFLTWKNNRQGHGLNHIALMGGPSSSLISLEHELKERGIRILKRDEQHLCFEDPNEFAVEVYAALEAIEQPRLETARLILEPFQDSDLEDIFDYAKDPRVTLYVPWKPHRTIEDSKSFLNTLRQRTCHAPGRLFFSFAIRSKQTGKVIGAIDFKNPQPWTGQIDYVLSAEHWNRGLMTEAAQAVKDWALHHCPDMVRFQAGCLPENKGSSRVMEKLGMTFEGIRQKSHHWGQDEYKSLAFYAWVR